MTLLRISLLPLIIFAPLYCFAQGYIGEHKDLSSETLSSQIRCVHHDNFYREVVGAERWMIGENYDTELAYYSPRNDYWSVDDGFRIHTVIEETNDVNFPHKVISGYLTNDKSVEIPKAYRLSPAHVFLKNNFIIESSVPSTGYYSEIVWNFVDESNYESLEIHNDSNGCIVLNYKKTHKEIENETEIFRANYDCSSINIAYINCRVNIYLDEYNIYSRLTERSVVDS